ncbi:MAG: alpha/beta family hydrolase [Endozoicomonas sp.]
MEMIWSRAPEPIALLILAHGAGAAMDSDFMNTMAGLLCDQGITVVRFEFPYMQARRETGKKRPPDRQPKLLECWSGVLEEVRGQTDLPVYIGGKSMGGRMATLLVSEGEQVPGVVCLGYPFHAAGKKDKPRTEHLKHMDTPVLVIQGDRDAMGGRETVSGYELSGQVRIEWLEDGNHDLKPRKVSGYSHQRHLERAAQRVMAFMADK